MSRKTNMNHAEYKRLGDYIRAVDVRNKDGAVTKLLGVSVAKVFMTSIANTIGTDMSVYKIVEQGQFVYIADTSRRGDKIAIAQLSHIDKVIVSQAYTVFEVKDVNELLPEYLMMWFRRPEFDRYARFHSHGSAREIFDWSEMCDVELPVPDIARQREIVAEYEILSRRIRLNEQMISKLEETAQTLYRKMFVDGIDKENLPEGWRMGTLGEIATFKYGKLADRHIESVEFPYPIFSGYAITGYTNKFTLKAPTVVIIARGDAGTGKICMSPPKCFLSNLAIAIEAKKQEMKYYLYYHLLNSDTVSLRSGSAQAQITINSVESFKIVIPILDICIEFFKKIEILYRNILLYNKKNRKLIELQSLLLAKIG